MPIKSQEESISSLQWTRDGTAAASPLNSVFDGRTVERRGEGPMDSDLRSRFDEKTTEELIELLRAHDLTVWRPEVFPIIETILQERRVDVAAIKALPPRHDCTSTEDSADFVRLLDLTDLAMLGFAKSALEEAGIEFFILNEGTQDLFGAGQMGGYSFITGPPVLMVEVSRMDEARELLAPLLKADAPEAEEDD
jgi:putative signal transducing protein